MRTTSFVATAALLFASTTTQMVWAQEDASSTAAARSIGTEGLRLAESGNCKDAVEKLERAEKLHHAPTTLAKLGECQIQLGKIVVGLEALRRVIREQVAPDAPPAFQAAKARAQKVFDDNQNRIAQLHINVTLPSGVTPQVMVDGEPVPAALVDQDRPTDPGPHTVEASAQSYKKASQSVTLKEGERLAITLNPEFDPTATPPPTSNTSNGSSTQNTVILTPEPRPKWLIGTWIATGVLAAGAITTGIITMSNSSSLSDARKNEPTPGATLDDKSSTTKTFALVTDIVGASAIVLGAVSLYFTLKSQPSIQAPTASRASLRLGLGRAEVVGQF